MNGKFATNPDVTPKIPVFENNQVRLIMGDDEQRNPVYTAMGSFITAYARDITIRAAQENYDSFAYADTDSLHLLVDEDPEGLEIDPHGLGAWKFEYKFTEGVFIRAKQYCERLPMDERVRLGKDGKLHPEFVTHIAGMPEDLAKTVTIEDLGKTKEYHGKLMPVRVPGGIVLVDSTFTLKIDESLLDPELLEDDFDDYELAVGF